MSIFTKVDFNSIVNIEHRIVRYAAKSWLARPFRSISKCRVLVYYNSGPISLSQIEPLFLHADTFYKNFGAEFRALPISDFLKNRSSPEADVVIIQPWFTLDGSKIAQSLDILKNRNPRTRIIFLDSYAHNDLRLALYVDPYIDLYYKKSLYRDNNEYFIPRKGDTKITEYYGTLYNIDMGPPVNWEVPKTIIPKLRLYPGFFTLSRFTNAFGTNSTLPLGGRNIDVHSRLGGASGTWHEAMRSHVQQSLQSIPRIKISGSERVNQKAFMNELAHSTLCLSPFGFGELCWRDVEAMQMGAVVLKQDMGHLVTLPNIFESDLTYAPLNWDFSNLSEVIDTLLVNRTKADTIANSAWERIHKYVVEKRFVDDVAEIFPN